MQIKTQNLSSSVKPVKSLILKSEFVEVQSGKEAQLVQLLQQKGLAQGNLCRANYRAGVGWLVWSCCSNFLLKCSCFLHESAIFLVSLFHSVGQLSGGNYILHRYYIMVVVHGVGRTSLLYLSLVGIQRKSSVAAVQCTAIQKEKVIETPQTRANQN